MSAPFTSLCLVADEHLAGTQFGTVVDITHIVYETTKVQTLATEGFIIPTVKNTSSYYNVH